MIQQSGPDSASGLKARLGVYTATTVVVGSMIGSGIFKKPAVMAEQLHSPTLLLGTWVLAGIITCFGALTNAEIAGMFPRAGGQYVFFRRMYNDFVGFTYGWAVFAVIQTGSIASIAYVFAEYLGYFITLPRLSPELEAWSFGLGGLLTVTPLSHLGLKLLTAGTIVGLTAVNVAGVLFGGAIQAVITTLKVLAVAAVVLAAFALGPGDTAHFVEAGPGMTPLSGALATVAAVGLALSGAFWGYDGWNNVTYLAGEVRRAHRTIPRALMVGTALVVGVYLAVNLAYLYILPVSRMAGSTLVAADVMQGVLGPTGGALVSALVVLSTFGSTNGSILASARVSFAMAQDGLFFSPLARIHPRFSTPHVALIAQAAWACLLVFSGTFDQLTDMLVFVSWIFYALGAAGVFVLRRNRPDADRPYRVWGYPVVPALFVAFASAYVLVTLAQNPRNAGLGLLLCALGLPLYLRRRRQRP